MNSAFANSRSGLMQPGTIAKQSSSSRMLQRTGQRYSDEEADRMAELNRSKSTTQAPEARKTGPGGGTTSRSVNGPAKMHGRANSVASSATRPATRSSVRQPPRPHSSLAGPRKLNGPSIPRPATSLDTHEEEPTGNPAGKRKGRRQSQCFSHASFSLPGRSLSGLHGDTLQNCIKMQTSLPDIRSVSRDSRSSTSSSLCRAMDNLTLNQPPTGPQPAQEGPRKPSPSKIPTMSTPVKSFPDKPSSPIKHGSKRHPSPITPFLTKDSTVKAFNIYTDAEWDREDREKRLEEYFNTFFSRATQAGQESFGLKETVELYKTRSKHMSHGSRLIGWYLTLLRVQ